MALTVPCFVLFLLGLMPAPVAEGQTDWALSDWTRWRDQWIAHVLEPTQHTDGARKLNNEEVSRRSLQAYESVKTLLSTDARAHAGNPAWQLKVSRFVAFIKAQALMQSRDEKGAFDHVLGLTIADDDYWEYAFSYVKLPELLRRQDFLAAVSAARTYKAAVQIIEKNNTTLAPAKRWTVVPYKAQFILSVDRTTYGRLLVFVPNVEQLDGSVVDQWIQFAIATPDQARAHENQSVSVVAIRKNVPPDGTTGAYMVDYVRVRESRNARIQLVPTMKLPHNPSKNCYDCHKSAVIPIRPEIEYDFDKSGMLVPKPAPSEVLATLNTRIRGYGRANVELQDQAAYGPSIGQAGRDRPDDYVRSLIPQMNLPVESLQRVKDSMKCSSCHDAFAPLNYLLAVPSNRDDEAFKSRTNMVQTYVEKGWMPPGNTLTATEREALWKCLSREYFDPESGKGAFVDWLRGR